MELNYDFDYEYYENSHRAERIGDMYYRYDGNGNVVEERYGGHSAADAAGAGYRYEDGIYSTDYGFALTRPNSGSSGNDGVYERRYTWDYRNQLLRTKDNHWTVNYRYGHDGQRRVKYTEETRSETLYFNNMWQTSTSGNGSEWLQSKHIFVGESRIATKSNKEIGGKTEGNLSFETEHQYWYHSDHLGSAQLTTGRSGELHERIEYTPYGEIWVEHKYDLAEGSLPYRFTGKELDEETGYYYYGARYLDPRTSRWISTDPAVGDYVPSAPVDDEAKKRNGNLPGMGGVFNLVNLHVYHYAGNNPVKLVDPDGRTPKTYRLSENRYMFYADKSTLGGAVSSVFKDTFLIPFIGGSVEAAINAKFRFKDIVKNDKTVSSKKLGVINNLSSTVSLGSTIADILEKSSALIANAGIVGTIINWSIAAYNAKGELDKKDSVGMDLYIERYFGNELIASTHEGVADLYFCLRERLKNLKEGGVFLYSTDDNGNLCASSGLNESDYNNILQELHRIKTERDE
jgi:RHS repeat-associated protein